MPASHGPQVEEPSEPWYWPVEHSVHALAPDAAYCPAVQAVTESRPDEAQA